MGASVGEFVTGRMDPPKATSPAPHLLFPHFWKGRESDTTHFPPSLPLWVTQSALNCSTTGGSKWRRPWGFRGRQMWV